MYMKSIPRELAVTMADDPCIPIDGLFVYIDVKTKNAGTRERRRKFEILKPRQ
jgi:hypothetical protein